jgi:hypothetical protein
VNARQAGMLNDHRNWQYQGPRADTRWAVVRYSLAFRVQACRRGAVSNSKRTKPCGLRMCGRPRGGAYTTTRRDTSFSPIPGAGTYRYGARAVRIGSSWTIIELNAAAFSSRPDGTLFARLNPLARTTSSWGEDGRAFDPLRSRSQRDSERASSLAE